VTKTARLSELRSGQKEATGPYRPLLARSEIIRRVALNSRNEGSEMRSGRVEAPAVLAQHAEVVAQNLNQELLQILGVLATLPGGSLRTSTRPRLEHGLN
jgi:hypothetical protein